jgi:hypothetical protein
MSNNKPTNKQLIAPTLMAMFKQAAHCVMALPFLIMAMFKQAAPLCHGSALYGHNVQPSSSLCNGKI